MNEVTLTRPDDWHIHLRDGDVLADTVADVSRVFARAIVMPNLVPPVVTASEALAYRDRILAARPSGSDFEPLMTLYLTDKTTPASIEEAARAGVVAAKLYPSGATTNSDAGVTDLRKVVDAIEAMQACGMRLLVHGEVTDSEVDIFDREARFIETHLAWLVDRFPRLNLVLEHITTAAAVAFVRSAPANVGATITAHHLLMSRNAMLAGGIRPHLYCLPILKRETDRQALVDAATSGEPKFFLGTDSAPHAKHRKEHACGCAGTYTAHAALALYAEVFDAAGALDRLEGFASHHGPDFYGLPRNASTVTLTRERQQIPESLAFGGDVVVPLRAGGEVAWRVR